ncbi:MAG: CBS domain-containing protein [Candidatus Obscuribacterales bacterium]
MEIVITHNNMDFDALAAQFAVTRLYPSVKMVLGYPLVGNVREFLSLYRSSLPIVQAKYVDLEQVTRIFVVDCQNLDRVDETIKRFLASTDSPPPITVFDHHADDPAGLAPIATPDSVLKSAGSATSLVVELLRKKKVSLTPFEATVMALGIYEDTGSLSYRGTTEIDATCVAYLLKHGADLEQVNTYIRPRLSDEQTSLLEELVANASVETFEGFRVLTAYGAIPHFIDGLAGLTRKLMEILSCEAGFTAVHMKDRVHLVGRSDSRSIDVASVVRLFGGDGHPGAGSAVVRNASPEEIVTAVKSSIASRVQPQPTASDIMISPVRTIATSTTMDEANRLMLRHGVDGLIVTADEEVVGVVSRRDIDQAMHHRLGHAPVQGFMSRPVISVSPDTPVDEIQAIMVTEDIGRLPVMHDHRLVGLVSRADVLSRLYGARLEPTYLGVSEPAESFGAPPLRGRGAIKHDFLKSRFDKLEPSTIWLCKTLGDVAARHNMVAYAVGGFVRDLMLGRANFDLDFVVEGSARELAACLEAEFPGRLEVVASHDRFDTATLFFHAESRKEVDLSTARTEYYEFPAALPTVEPSRLEQDLSRRDFTINTLAVCLNPGRYGDLVDVYDGLSDIKRKIIRILHPFSFIEDPTRIVRAARFAARLGFHLDEKTRDRARKAISIGIFDNLGGVRLREEIRMILESGERLTALDLLDDLGGCLRFLDGGLEYSARIKTLIRRAERLLRRYPVSEGWVVHLGLLLSDLSPDRLDPVLDRLHLANHQKSLIRAGLALGAEVAAQVSRSGDLKRSQIYAIFKGQKDEALAMAACLAAPGTRTRRMILLYLEDLLGVKVVLSGRDLVELGVPQGPEIGAVLDALLAARLDGEIASVADEKRFVRSRVGRDG